MIREQCPHLGLALTLGLALLLPAGARERDRNSQKEEERPLTKPQDSSEAGRNSRRPPSRPPGDRPRDRPREDQDPHGRKRRRPPSDPCPDTPGVSEGPHHDGWDDNIIVEVRPPNAEIYAGGLRYGRRKAKFGLPSGNWRLELRAPGHETEVIHLEVQQGIRYHVKRTLRSRPAADGVAQGKG